MALYNSEGTQLTLSTLLALTSDDADPLVSFSEDVYEDTQFEAGGSAIADAAASRVLKFVAHKEYRLSVVTAAYPVPTVTAVAPGTGSHLGGTAVTITGTGFTAGTEVIGGGGVAGTGTAVVKFGTAAATNVVVVSDTEITCTAPAVAASTVAVSVQTGAGTGSLAASFIYT